MGWTIERYPDWEYRLGCFLDEVKGRPRRLSFPAVLPEDWDCSFFVCEAVLRMTGRPVVTHLNHGWTRDWVRMIVDHDKFNGFIKRVMTAVGAPEIPVAESRKGDVLIVEPINGQRAVGLRLGEFFAAPDDKGLSYAPMSMAISAYRI